MYISVCKILWKSHIVCTTAHSNWIMVSLSFHLCLAPNQFITDWIYSSVSENGSVRDSCHPNGKYILLSLFDIFFSVWASWFYSIILFCFVFVSRTHSCNNTSTHRQRMCSIWLNTITLYMGLCHSICKQFYVLFYWWCWASWCCCECLFLLMANASIWIFFGSFTCMFLRTFRIFFLLCVFNLTSSISVVEYTQIVYYLYELYLIHKNSINCL